MSEEKGGNGRKKEKYTSKQKQTNKQITNQTIKPNNKQKNKN